MISSNQKEVHERTKGEINMLTVEQWVRELNAIPLNMVEKLYSDRIDDFVELTTPREGDTVYYYGNGDTYEVLSTNGNQVTLEIDDEEVEVPMSEVSCERDTWLPMWGWMWMMNQLSDEDWILNHLDTVSNCGFRIFQDQADDYLFIGIDGAGYDFYSHHWEPLFNARFSR